MVKKKYISAEPCASCGAVYLPRCFHHVTTRAAGGRDVPNNMMSFCFICHEKIHRYGYGKMCELFPEVKAWLIDHNRQDILDKISR